MSTNLLTYKRNLYEKEVINIRSIYIKIIFFKKKEIKPILSLRGFLINLNNFKKIYIKLLKSIRKMYR